MTLTADEVAMFHAIFTCAERVDWACYESFRLRILAEGAEQTAAASRSGHASVERRREPPLVCFKFRSQIEFSGTVCAWSKSGLPSRKTLQRRLGEAAEEIRTRIASPSRLHSETSGSSAFHLLGPGDRYFAWRPTATAERQLPAIDATSSGNCTSQPPPAAAPAWPLGSRTADPSVIGRFFLYGTFTKPFSDMPESAYGGTLRAEMAKRSRPKPRRVAYRGAQSSRYRPAPSAIASP